MSRHICWLLKASSYLQLAISIYIPSQHTMSDINITQPELTVMWKTVLITQISYKNVTRQMAEWPPSRYCENSPTFSWISAALLPILPCLHKASTIVFSGISALGQYKNVHRDSITCSNSLKQLNKWCKATCNSPLHIGVAQTWEKSFSWQNFL